MKHRFTALLLAVLLLAGVAGCGGGAAQPEEDALRLLATTYPVYLFATAVTGGVEGVEVELLVNQPTACLHDYTLTVNDMKAIERADVILLNGTGLEDFMSAALAASSAAVVDCSQGVALLPALGHEGHDHDTEYDPHFWMAGEAAVAMLRNIAQGLSRLDSAHSELYNRNLEEAVAALTLETLDGADLECPYLITFHDGFQYFAQDNGLILLKSIEEEEGSEASAAEIKEIVALIGEYGIPAIFTEKNGSDATAKAIQRETGVAVYQLELIMSGEDSGLQPYLDAQSRNYAVIREALG